MKARDATSRALFLLMRPRARPLPSGVANFSVTGEGVAPQTADLAADVRSGLLASPKRLSCRWFYDAAGARIFEEICALPEYYLTRAEQEILSTRSREIVAALPPACS